jgi:pilus assembly protein CpaB
MLLVALLAGLMAVVMAARWVQGQGGDGSRIAVASQDITLGTVLTPDMLKLVGWPKGQEPAGAHTDLTRLQGRVITTSLQRGEPVLDGRLAPEGTKGGLVSLVVPGKRAMTVRVNDVVGVAGFALPGTFVDVLVSTQEDSRSAGERERMISKIVLERMLVLAVAQEVDRDPTKPKVVNAVTLEVTPQQAEVLDLARSVGTLSLVLRNQTERVGAATAGVTKEELLGLRRAPPPPPPPAPAPVVAAAPPPVRATARPVRVSVPVTAAAPAPTVTAPATTCVEIIRGLSKVTECF